VDTVKKVLAHDKGGARGEERATHQGSQRKTNKKAKRKEAKCGSGAGEIGKGQLHVKCLHESGDEDQRHRRIDIGSLNKGKTGGDGCHRMSFDRRLLKSDWFRGIDPTPRSRTWPVKRSGDPLSALSGATEGVLKTTPLSSQGPGLRRILMAYIGLVSLTATKFRVLPGIDDFVGGNHGTQATPSNATCSPARGYLKNKDVKTSAISVHPFGIWPL
jgi:hypothetical protein